MAAKGHGSARIVLVPRPREARAPDVTASRPEPAPAPDAPRGDARRGGWTTQRLMVGASLGGVATLVGGIVFKDNFTLLTGSRGAILAIAFGLFIIGLIAFFGCLIGLVAAGIRSLAARRGWPLTALAMLTPTAVVYGLWQAGTYGVMYPGLFTLLLAGGFVIAVGRR